MSSQKSKRSALQQARAWNPDPEHVKADLFVTHPFFDPEDKAQVKYEMLRHREVDGTPLEVSCREFGFTRESYRHLLERFRSEGMGALRAQAGPEEPSQGQRPGAEVAAPGARPRSEPRSGRAGAALPRTIRRAYQPSYGLPGACRGGRREKKTPRESKTSSPQRVMAFSAGAVSLSAAMSAGGKQRFPVERSVLSCSGGCRFWPRDTLRELAVCAGYAVAGPRSAPESFPSGSYLRSWVSCAAGFAAVLHKLTVYIAER